MCLKTITWQTDDPKQFKNKLKWETGYKVFLAHESDGNTFTYPHYNEYATFTLDKVLKADASRKIYGYNDPYVAGFHIFTKEMAAKLFVTENGLKYRALFEVKYRKISAIGTHDVHTQYPVDCVVAQEMKIVRRMEWPTEPKQKKLRVWRNDTGKARSGD